MAHPVLAQRLLGEGAREVLGGADPEGMARLLLPAVRELLLSSSEIETQFSSLRARLWWRWRGPTGDGSESWASWTPPRRFGKRCASRLRAALCWSEAIRA